MEYQSSAQVCKLLNVSLKTLDNWVRAGIVRPAVNPRGTGNQRHFAAVPDVLAIAVGRGLRGTGFTLQVAATAMKRLMGLSEVDLILAFAEGRKYQMVVAQDVSDHLVDRETIARAAGLNPPLAAALGLTPIAVDVHRVYENLKRQIANRASGEPSESQAVLPAEPVEAE